MEYTILGRTGLKVSVAGLGCGGPSRLGLRDNVAAEAGAVSLVRQAIDLGVNFLDTAQSYGTEPVVGKAIAGLPREHLIISTKKTLPPVDHNNRGAGHQGSGAESEINRHGLYRYLSSSWRRAERLCLCQREIDAGHAAPARSRQDSLYRCDRGVRDRYVAPDAARKFERRSVGRGDGRF